MPRNFIGRPVAGTRQHAAGPQRFAALLPMLLAGLMYLSATAAIGRTQESIDIEEPPFSYSDTDDDNPVRRLIDDIAAKKVKLDYDDESGYLHALLKQLDIPVSSQVLVFSKTSMQFQAISRKNPRAIYFNDETYVGWVRGSSLMEISTSDPKLGAAFYTLEMKPWRPDFARADYDCLACHATSMTRGLPGHTVRSVLPRIDGTVDPQKPSYVTDHSSPFAERWGGWYVTGKHGEMKHMGNAFLRGDMLDTRHNGNRLNLRDLIDTSDWASPYSDIVALMVMEHQTQMHNVFTQANFTVRKLKHDAVGDGGPTDPAEHQAVINQAAEAVVKHMLFCNETPLTSEVKGSVQFQSDFLARGPTDAQGRSLRTFDLKTRLFRFPCSYLIYSPTFDALEPGLRSAIYARLHKILTAADPGEDYQHLDAATRAAIFQIVQETKTELPTAWAEPSAASLPH